MTSYDVASIMRQSLGDGEDPRTPRGSQQREWRGGGARGGAGRRGPGARQAAAPAASTGGDGGHHPPV